ncbi:hypothetical protein QBC38DRAFT_522323 [Podospora fimiseda]|uniref:Uncharacterized protein n=1 Tax=Podospora fimiseda TaxID=252190 RepID=A0AAN7BGI2_9PEZI|nr:hypothetical protein QBC38DRAFT_522323 [Podospora fimiseda]
MSRQLEFFESKATGTTSTGCCHHLHRAIGPSQNHSQRLPSEYQRRRPPACYNKLRRHRIRDGSHNTPKTPDDDAASASQLFKVMSNDPRLAICSWEERRFHDRTENLNGPLITVTKESGRTFYLVDRNEYNGVYYLADKRRHESMKQSFEDMVGREVKETLRFGSRAGNIPRRGTFSALLSSVFKLLGNSKPPTKSTVASTNTSNDQQPEQVLTKCATETKAGCEHDNGTLENIPVDPQLFESHTKKLRSGC